MTLLLTFIFACGGTPSADANAEQKTAVASTVDKAKLAEALQLADAADGTEDKVAHKCAGCALAMDGSADHALEVEGVTLHLCSAMCKSHFSKNISGNVLKLLQ